MSRIGVFSYVFFTCDFHVLIFEFYIFSLFQVLSFRFCILCIKDIKENEVNKKKVFFFFFFFFFFCCCFFFWGGGGGWGWGVLLFDYLFVYIYILHYKKYL